MSKCTKDFERAQSDLKQFLQNNKDMIDKFMDLVDVYNSTRSVVVKELKLESEREGGPRTQGPFSTTLRHEEVWDLDRVEEIISPEEFNFAVKIEYKLHPNGVGNTVLSNLTDKYPALRGLHRRVIKSTPVTGPKEIDLGEIPRITNT